MLARCITLNSAIFYISGKEAGSSFHLIFHLSAKYFKRYLFFSMPYIILPQALQY